MTYDEVSDNFVKKYGDDLYQAIFETFYNYLDNKEESTIYNDIVIFISDVEYHGRECRDATFYGYFMKNGNRVDFKCQDGNSRGSLMQYFEEEIKPRNYFTIFYVLFIVFVGFLLKLSENKEK